jgi:hypothetical protein
MERRRKILAAMFATVCLGIAVDPLSLYLMDPESFDIAGPFELGLIIKAALPFIASLVVLLITREPQIAFASAVPPLIVSALGHLFVVLESRKHPLAGLLLFNVVWLNLLLVFPFALWIGIRKATSRAVGEPSNKSLERTREG